MTPAFHVSHGCHALVAANVAIRGRNPVGDVSMPDVLTLPHPGMATRADDASPQIHTTHGP